MALFDKTYLIQKKKIDAGYKCLNCPHLHLDHSYYTHLCLIGDCPCPGMKYDPKQLEPIKRTDASNR